MNPVLTFADAEQLAWLFNSRPRVIVHASILWASAFPAELRDFAGARANDIDFALAFSIGDDYPHDVIRDKDELREALEHALDNAGIECGACAKNLGS